MSSWNNSDVLKLITSAYTSALGHASWERFLSDLSEASGGIKTHLFGFDSKIGLTLQLVQSGYDPESIDSYLDYYGELNAWAPGFANFAQGRVIDSLELFPQDQLLTTEFYNDWLRPQENITSGVGAALHKASDRVVAIGGHIRERDVPHQKENWTRLLGVMLPHVQQAFDVSRALAGAKLETHLVASNRLDQVPAVILLSGRGDLVFANSKAEELIQRGDSISVDVLSAVEINIPSLGGFVGSQLIWQAVVMAGGSKAFQVAGAAPTCGLKAHCLLVDPEVDAAQELYKALWVTEPSLLVLIADEAEREERLDTILRQRFKLTDAERTVAKALAEGMLISEIADLRQVSRHTVRDQVKTVLSKTGSRTQSALVKLIVQLS